MSLLRIDRASRLAVLMLTHRLPYPPDRGDRIRSYHMLRVLSRHFDVDLACTNDEPVLPQHRQWLGTMARRVAVEPMSRRLIRLKGAAVLLTGRALAPACYYHGQLARQVVDWHRRRPYDVVLTYCTGMIQYARLLNAGQGAGPRQVIDLVDVDSLKWHSYAADTRGPMRWIYRAEARRLRQIERGDHDHFDAVIVTTPAEAQTYRRHVGHHAGLHVVANGVDLDYYQPLPDAAGKTIVFVGVLDYKPNVDGITWFVDTVMPPLLDKHPDARLLIVGRDPAPAISSLHHRRHVQVVGPVPDVRRYLQAATTVIAPLQLARGVQNKVLEAMAGGRAVVCSPAAAAGINAGGPSRKYPPPATGRFLPSTRHTSGGTSSMAGPRSPRRTKNGSTGAAGSPYHG